MGMFGNFFGGEKPENKGRENLGFDAQAVPGDREFTADEVGPLERRRLHRESLERKITRIEQNPQNDEYSQLETLREELRNLGDGN